MSKRILIIDDEPSICESLSGILEDEGFVAVVAASAERGIDLIEEENIDLVLLDIWLGDNMDGLTALGRIRERFSLLPVCVSRSSRWKTACSGKIGPAGSK
jgi:two-component system nitrogen regulation response regulator NtrX